MRHVLLLTACLLAAIALSGQKRQKGDKQKVEVVTVEGSYRMVQTEDLSESYCKREALEQARLHAIERRFGSYLSSGSVMLGSSYNEHSQESYSHYSTIDVRGIWMGDDDTKIRKLATDDGKTLWEAWVKGRARERSTTHVDYDVHLLVNGTTLRHESSELFDKDHFVISFKSPVGGYVMAFASDGEVVSKFVPGQNDGPSLAVEAGRDYLFPNETYFTADIAEGRQVEYYKLIVLFSRNELVAPNFSPSKRKPYSNESADVYPVDEMRYKDFSRYYEQQLSRDPSLEPRIVEMVIRQRK